MSEEEAIKGEDTEISAYSMRLLWGKTKSLVIQRLGAVIKMIALNICTIALVHPLRVEI